MRKNFPYQIFLSVAFLFSISTSYSQQIQWSKQLSFNTQNLIGGVNCDTLNNIYIGGTFLTGSHPSWANAWNGFYRAKLDPNGNLLWSDTTRLIGTHYPILFLEIGLIYNERWYYTDDT